MSKDQNITRKLKAILSADVKGYSLLMADDEVLTLKTLNEYRDIMSELIQAHSGRVVDSVGDNMLAEFSSAVDAVECAIEIQKRLKKENTKFVDERKLQFRIGINIGDVIHDGDRIVGEGVNIASRIESLADTGGICISRNTFDQIEGKIDIQTKYLGEHQVKNIKKPVRVYKVLLDSDSYEPLVKEIFELPDKPSIAVLPFDNMSGDPSQEYFSDGLTEQIINGLCKVPDLFVIARNSSFSYKEKALPIKQVAKELGVKFILEGSVQRAGDRVRITTQLIDAITDFHMWSENYDRDLEDIFALQDEITMKVISAMDVQLIHGEQAKLWSGFVTRDIKAYEKCMKARELLTRANEQDNAQGRKYAEEAISIDPDYPFPYVVVGFSHWVDLWAGWSIDILNSFEQAEKKTIKAIQLSKDFDYPHILLGLICLQKKQHDKAVSEGQMAITINPNGANAHAYFASILNYCGKPQKALEHLARAFRLNPLPPSYYYSFKGHSYRMLGEYAKAIDNFKKTIHISPNNLLGYIGIAISFSLVGNISEARDAVLKILSIDPNFSIDLAILKSTYKKDEYLDIAVKALRKAGVPEHSPE